MAINPDVLFSHLTQDLLPYNNGEVANFARDYLLSSVFKKLVTNKSASADSVALSKFLDANLWCQKYKLLPKDMFDDYVIGEVRNELRTLTVPDDIFSGFDFGPGSCHKSANSSLLSKLDGDWTTTSKWVYGQFIQAARNDPSLMALANKKVDGRYKIVDGSKLCFVPKKNSESRTIACEPLLNMALQKSVEMYLTRYLRYQFGCDLSSQQFRNRRLARAGSIDGSFATIDLSSASDTVSLQLCSEILPPCMFELLCSIRSPSIVLPDRTSLKLHMISSMGNATTFPLETIIFSAIVRAVYRLHNKSYDYCVFGDDIIVARELYEHTVHSLELFGFKINSEKSFSVGRFRESCGGDYFDGRNVRPVYITALKTQQDILSALNRLVMWSARHAFDLSNTVSYLRSFLRNQNAVPLYEDVSCGLLTFKVGGWGGTYKRYLPIQHYEDLDKFSEDSKCVAFLRGNLRSDKVARRVFFSPKYRLSAGFSVNWNWFDKFQPLLEDVNPKNYELWLFHYGLVSCSAAASC